MVRLEGVPQSSIGAPIPLVVSNEGLTLVAYCQESPDPAWDGTSVRVVGPDTTGEEIAIVRFSGCYATMFGPPNDEAFGGHPLEARGLEPYGAFEVLDSSWRRGLEKMNSVHPYHQPEQFAKLRHFILSFHDSTFECVAERIETVESFRGSMNEALLRMAKLLAWY